MPESSAIPPVQRAKVSTTPPITNRTPPQTSDIKTEKPKLGERIKRQLSTRAKIVRELLTIPMIPLAGMATYQHARNPGELSPYALDVRTLELHGDELSQAFADFADGYPVLAAMLDRIGTVTPLVALATAAMTIGAQFAENHGKLPDTLRGVSPAVIGRQDLAAMMVAEAAEAAGVDGFPGNGTSGTSGQ